MTHVLYVAVGGAIGSVCRYGVAMVARRLLGPEVAFPWWTLGVNVVGCFLIGLLFAAAGAGLRLSDGARVGLSAGFLGGLTTFSSFGYETLALWQGGDRALAAANVGASLVLGLGAVALGVWLGRTLLA